MAQMNHSPEKCTIRNLDNKEQVVDALFNPTELSLSKSVPWSPHDDSKGDRPTMEFTKAEPMELDVELLFDTYEARQNVYEMHVKRLQSFAFVIKDKKRPPMCRFAWGEQFPEFTGVITSLSIKYTMFLKDGTPCRATCSVKMKQAEDVELGEDAATPQNEEQRRQSSPGRTAQQGDERRADKLGDDHRAGLDEIGSEDGTVEPGQPVPRGA